MTFEEDTSAVDREIQDLGRKAVEEIEEIDTDSNQEKKEINAIADRKKKDIIIRLAKELEGKIPTDTICRVMVNLLDGHVSKSLVRRCLDKKYKDDRRSRNASKPQKQPNPSCHTNLNPLLLVEENEKLTPLIEDNDLAPLVLLDNAEEVKVEEKEENTKPGIIIETSGGQQLIQKSNDSNDEDSPASSNSDPIFTTPTMQGIKSDESSEPFKLLSNGVNKHLTSPLSKKCPECKIKDEIILEKENKIEQLETVISKSNQLVPAYKLKEMANHKNGENIPFVLSLSLEELLKDIDAYNNTLASHIRIIFSGYVTSNTGETVSEGWEIRAE
jgi:hypothetical protein